MKPLKNNLKNLTVRVGRRVAVKLRERAEALPRELAPDEVLDLRFFQFRERTAPFFYERLGRTEVRVRDTPHYSLAAALTSGSEEERTAAERYYTDYLHASWPEKDHDKIAQRLAKFKSDFARYRDGTDSDLPACVLSSLETEGDLFVVDGNHRCAFSAAVGRRLGARLWPIDLVFLAFSDVGTFYGTGHKGQPYQSILFRQQTIVQGRRDDLIRRLQLIPEHVIQGRRVLDVASNFGMSSILAKQLGGDSCVGLELSQELVNFATRFAMFEGLFPNVQYKKFNLDGDSLHDGESFDTAFMFSIYAHLSDPSRLRDLASKNVRKWVVFESHPRHSYENYRDFFDSGIFSSVREIGKLPESRTNQELTRIVWLCEK